MISQMSLKWLYSTDRSFHFVGLQNFPSMFWSIVLFFCFFCLFLFFLMTRYLDIFCFVSQGYEAERLFMAFEQISSVNYVVDGLLCHCAKKVRSICLMLWKNILWTLNMWHVMSQDVAIVTLHMTVMSCCHETVFVTLETTLQISWSTLEFKTDSEHKDGFHGWGYIFPNKSTHIIDECCIPWMRIYIH